MKTYNNKTCAIGVRVYNKSEKISKYFNNRNKK